MTPPEVDRSVPPARDASGLPQAPLASERAEDAPTADDGEEASRSLAADVEALIEDGKTYLEAELVYQKTRAAFVADRAKGAFIYGAVAAMFGFLALIGLTVGLIIALTPLLTAWGASALVVLLLLGAAFVAMKQASARWSRLMAAIDEREARP